MTILSQDFFRNTAEVLAPSLLGKFLCVEKNGIVSRRRITETECYVGEADTACHARMGKTKRNSIMYLDGGHAYVYLCYGIHYLLNIISGREGTPEGVLLRGVELAKGPGVLTQSMGVDLSFNGKLLSVQNNIWIEDDGFLAAYKTAKRVGIGYASQHDQDRQWRFIATNI